MRLRVDIEGKSVTLLAIGGVGLKLGAVRHHHLDPMIVGVEVFKLLHGYPTGLCAKGSEVSRPWSKRHARRACVVAPAFLRNPAPHTARLVATQARTGRFVMDLRSRLDTLALA